MDDDITRVNNIGEKRAQALRGLGINTVGQLLNYFPREYLDRSKQTSVSGLVPGLPAVVRAKAVSVQTSGFGGKTVTTLTARDDTGKLELCWFNQPYMKNAFKIGREYLFSGKPSVRFGAVRMDSPDYEPYSENPLSALRITPVHRLPSGLSQKTFRGVMRGALDVYASAIQEILPPPLLARFDLRGRAFAVCNIHFPADDASYFAARRRLVFEELFMVQVFLFEQKARAKAAAAIVFTNPNLATLTDRLPYKLTNAQNRAIAEIAKDCAGEAAMNRLVQGDVGSGKTFVAMAACLFAVQHGGQAAVMAPTETLARQHEQAFAEAFEPLGVTVALLAGSVPAKDKSRIKSSLANGGVQIIIGTHALLQDNVTFKNLGVVVTDEQHRFGVRQRLKLTAHGAPHVLVMSATPIPRTLALILYGDMDVSIIDEMPPGRQKIDTFAVTGAYKPRIYKFIRGLLNEGRQAYVICPVIDGAQSDMTGAADCAEDLAAGAFAGYSVGLLHGKLAAAKKNEVMSRFASGEIQLLVSTTVVEVGVNVPNAAVMLIENAERFGLSQLHQLRGRVGRGAHKSYCVLITDAKNDVTRERMKAMTATGDGFKLSELDLRLRGPGEFFGTRQHGLPEFLLSNLYEDGDVLGDVRDAAKTFADAPELDALRAEMARRMAFTEKITL